MGMVFLDWVSFLCSTAFCRSPTQMWTIFSAASAERRGLIFVRAYRMYFLSVSKGISVSASSRMILPWWRSRMWLAIRALFSGVLMSRTMKMQSKRERMVDWSQICSEICLNSSYRPWIGLAAARIDVREFSRVVMPALATEMVCCSMASWMATRSCGFILSNSSMQTIPPSASTKAPPSIWNSPVELSFEMLAVKPAAEEPLPDVQTAIDEVCSTNFRNCDLAVEGSPIRRMFISPLRTVRSGRCLREPPKSMQPMAFLISSFPKMPGAMDLQIFSLILGSLLICLKISSSCSVKCCEVRSFSFSMPVTQMYPLERFSDFMSATSMMPVMQTRSPGTHFETFSRSTTRLQVRAISPVGTSSGLSWIFRFWASMTAESGMATQGSLGHLCPPPAWPMQMVGTQGYCPGASSMILVCMQLRHLIFNLEALMQGLVELMIIPLTENSLETILELISRSLRGISSLRRQTCHSESATFPNSSFLSLMYERMPYSMTLSISMGLAMIFQQRCSQKAFISANSTGRQYFPFWVWMARFLLQILTFSWVQSFRKFLKVCWKWVLVPSTKMLPASEALKFWSLQQTRSPFIGRNSMGGGEGSIYSQ